MKKVLRIGVLLVVAIVIAAPAAAHNRIGSKTLTIDLRDVAAAHDDVQPLPLFAGAAILDELPHVELPGPSIADELARRFASADVESSRELRIFDRAVSGELASGPRRFTLQSKSSEWSELGQKPWWGEENKAYPLRDPATGLVYARARWYDAETGTFLTPDPMGYEDSSNLYAAFANDPVNNSDPTGEICERANASSAFDWAERCWQDIGWFAAAANEGIFDPRNAWRNTKRGAGGLVSTGALVKDTVVGVATLAWDATTMSVNDAAADRMVARGQAISNFVAHPIDSIVNAHTDAADAILAAEASGSYVALGRAAASVAQKDFLAAYGVHALGRAALARMAPSVTLEEGAYSANWFAENPLLGTTQAAAAVRGLLPLSPIVPNAGGFVRSFVTTEEQVFYRVYTTNPQGAFLTRIRPGSREMAAEGFALPPGNTARFIQEVRVPAGVRLQRSRALPAFGRRGGLEQFELLERIPSGNFGPGVEW